MWGRHDQVDKVCIHMQAIWPIPVTRNTLNSYKYRYILVAKPPSQLPPLNQLLQRRKDASFIPPFLPSRCKLAISDAMVMLKTVARKFQKKFSNSRDGVKEGHFAVMAIHDCHSKRFIVPLSFLTNPAFLRLLEEAEEEYGQHQQSILTVSCHPSEMEKILAGELKKERRVSSGVLLRAPW